jgi:predicted RNase H-like HicB family nuclease
MIAMRGYIGLIHTDVPNVYGVSFPDFPGCVTVGSSLADAHLKAQEALTLHVRGMMEDGEDIPHPSSLDDIMKDPQNAGSVAVLTVAPSSAPRAVRVNVTFAEDTLEEIDRYAESRGYTRSAFLAAAARKAISEKV